MIDKNDPRLTDFVLGELSATERSEIQSAIENSPELASVVDEIRQMTDLLGAAYLAEEPLTLSDDQKAELERVRQSSKTSSLASPLDSGSAKNGKASSSSARTGKRWGAIALAASLMGLMIGGAIYVNNSTLMGPETAVRLEKAKDFTPQDKAAREAKAGEKSDKRDALKIDDVLDYKKNLHNEADEPAGAVDHDRDMDSSDELEEETKRAKSRFEPGANEDKRESGFFVDPAMPSNQADDAKSGLNMVDSGVPSAGLGQPRIVLKGKEDELRGVELALDSALKEGKQESDDGAAGADTAGMAFRNIQSQLADVPESEPADRYQIVPPIETPDQSVDSQQGRDFGGALGGRGRAGGLGGLMPSGGAPGASGGLGGGGGGLGGRGGLDGQNRSLGRSRRAQPANNNHPFPNAPSSGAGNRSSSQSGEIGDGKTADMGIERFTFDGSQTTEETTDSVLDGLGVAGQESIQGRSGEPTGRPQGLARGAGPGGRLGMRGEVRPRFGGKAENTPAAGGEAEKAPAEGVAVTDPQSRAKALSRPMLIKPSPAKPAAPRSAETPSTPALAEANPKSSVDKSGADAPLEAAESGKKGIRGGLATDPPAPNLPASRPLTKNDLGRGLEEEKLAQQGHWYSYQELGIKVQEAIVDETRSRMTPVERIRTVEKMRRVKQDDGSFRNERFQVEEKYTEQLTENYTVQVPKRFAVLGDKESQKLVEDWTKRVDPDGKRVFELQELFNDNIRAYQQGKSEEASEGDSKSRDVEVAEKLLRELKENQSGQQSVDTSLMLSKLTKSLAKRNAEVRKTLSWKRVKAIPNTSRLMVGDKEELSLTGMHANVQVDGFRARVLLDCFYYNDRGRALEGNFKLRLPDDASLYYFAFGESAYDISPKGKLADEEFLGDETQFVSLGAPEIREARRDAWRNVKEARMVPREKAANAYRETVRRKVDPALVEWSGAGVFNASVSPLAPHKLHRIVIGYDVNLKKVDGNLVYEFDLPEQVAQCRVDLDVTPVNGVEYQIEPDSDPFEKEDDGILKRKYRFDGPQKRGIRLTASKSPEVLLQTNDDDEGAFWGIQIAPDLPIQQVTGNPRAMFLVDTSLSSNPDKFNVWLKLLEATLENNRDSIKQFGVVFFNVDAHFWRGQYADNTAENVAALTATCQSLALEGATDLYGAIEKVAASEWVHGSVDSAQPETGPDLFLLSDGAANWGETNLRLIGRQLGDHQLGSLFAYQTGMTGTAISELRFLAGQSGGAVFSVASEDEVKTASTAHRNRPWKLKTIVADGATDVMTAGRVQWVYPGQAITVVGRGNVDDQIELKLEQAGEFKTVFVSPTRVQSELASRLYGQVAVGQLESLGAKVFDVAASYARHFRVTGETCSLLMLESEADYKRFEIKPQEDLFVIKTKSAGELIESTLQKSAEQLADPKAQLTAWLQRLETMPGMKFKISTALGIALEDIQVSPVSQPLVGSLTKTDGLSKEYVVALGKEQLNYDLISREAMRRSATSVDEAIKVYSSLVERNPGNWVIARDVAFTAIELDRPAPAYHLLKQVAKARPFEGNVYPALGHCLTQMGQADMAIVYYEVALGGTFQRQGRDFKKIVSAEYMHLLRRIVAGELDSSVNDFAKARMETLSKNLDFKSVNLLITMMWNTDQSDVDLHVVEPNGEECSYENTRTRSGGQITDDITTGFGPEMYVHPNAPAGKYGIQVKYFGNDQNRASLRNKVHLSIYRDFGTDKERVTRRTILLKQVGEKEPVATIGVGK